MAQSGCRLNMAEHTKRLKKSDDTIVERIEKDILLTSRSSRMVHVLNEAGGLLWDALDSFNSGAELKSLLAEARPDLPGVEVADIVDQFVSQLLELGLVEEIDVEAPAKN